MKKFFQGWIPRAVFCAAVGVLDFLGFAFGSGATRWFDFAWGLVMVACVIANILFARQRKADTVATNSNSFQLGGYISAPLSLTYSASTNAPNTPAKDFAGLPFDLAIGEVYGLRMWRMDQYGRLRARNWHNAEPWRPGVNVAKCVAKADDDIYSSFMRAAGMYGSFTNPPKKEPKPPHDTPSESCNCGFYAYTDSRHAETVSYNQNGDHVVLGIIKGTGRTLIGTQGFRCEKAEIVALRDPTRGGTKTDPWRLQQLANLKRVYPDVPILESRAALLEFAPLTETLPDPSTDEFWSLP